MQIRRSKLRSELQPAAGVRMRAFSLDLPARVRFPHLGSDTWTGTNQTAAEQQRRCRSSSLHPHSIKSEPVRTGPVEGGGFRMEFGSELRQNLTEAGQVLEHAALGPVSVLQLPDDVPLPNLLEPPAVRNRWNRRNRDPADPQRLRAGIHAVSAAVSSFCLFHFTPPASSRKGRGHHPPLLFSISEVSKLTDQIRDQIRSGSVSTEPQSSSVNHENRTFRTFIFWFWT